jgi:predicted phosphodiesterase
MIKIELGDFDYAKIIPLSDLHIGDPDFDEKILLKYLKQAEEDNCFILLNGDMIEMATKDSLGDVYGQVLSPEKQYDKLGDLLTPYKHKILVATEGNHEYRQYKNTGLSSKRFYASLNIPFYPDEAWLKITVGRKKKNNKPVAYSVYMIHGHGGGRRTGSKANRLEDLGNGRFADLFIRSHTHWQMIFSDTYEMPNMYADRIRKVPRLFVNTGCFVGSRYAIRHEYKKSTLGTPLIYLNGREKRIKAEVSVEAVYEKR